MIEQTIYWCPMEEYGLPTGINNRKIWMVFKNILFDKFEVRGIERDYFCSDWHFSDCDGIVEFKSDSLIPVMWTDSLDNTVLNVVVKENV